MKRLTVFPRTLLRAEASIVRVLNDWDKFI